MPRIKPNWMTYLEMDVEAFRDDRADGVGLLKAIRNGIYPRARLAWAVNDVGQALLRLSTRLCDGCPSNFEQWFDDGYRMGVDTGRNDIVKLMVRGDTEISVVGRLIMELGLDPEKVVAHLEKFEVAR